MLNKSNSTISLFIEDQADASFLSLLFTQNIYNSVVVPNVIWFSHLPPLILSYSSEYLMIGQSFWKHRPRIK